MKIKDGFMLREIAGERIVVPLGDRMIELNGIMSLNETGTFLWELLQTEQSVDNLVDAMLEEYAIDRATVKTDIEEFLKVASLRGLLET